MHESPSLDVEPPHGAGDLHSLMVVPNDTALGTGHADRYRSPCGTKLSGGSRSPSSALPVRILQWVSKVRRAIYPKHKNKWI